MSFAWHEFRDHLARSTSTLTFQRSFDTIRRAQASVAPFHDPASLLDRLHRGPGEPEQKNLILSALVEAAQGDGPTADSALSLVLLALWPGLDAIRRRSMSRRIGSAEDITSDLLARATEAIRCLDQNRVNRIASTVLQNVERDMIRSRRREADRESAVSAIELEDVPAPPGADSTVDLLRRDVLRHAGSDGHLVLGVVIGGFSQAELAAALGLSEAATRKRYQRAVHRLRDVFSGGMSHSVPATGFSSAGAHAPPQEGAELMPSLDEAENLARLPGLYRAWEYPDVLETRRTYRLEEAGAHADGTPLVAIYANRAKDNDPDGVAVDGPKTGGA